MKKWFKWLMEGPEEHERQQGFLWKLNTEQARLSANMEHQERRIFEARGLADMVAKDLDAQAKMYAAFLESANEMRQRDVAIETRMAQIEIDYQGLHARLINMEMEATELARARADNEQLKGALAEAKGPQRVKSYKALRDVMAANEEGEL